MASDPYQELGVKRGASDAEIQKAFRKLAKELHPDQNKGNAASEERFKRITAAYDFLKDADKRKRFDRGEIDADGRETFRGFGGAGAGAGGGRQAGGSPFGAGGGAGFGGTQFDGIDLDDIMGMFGGGAAAGRRGAGFNSAPQKGSDLRIKLDIDLLDTIVGNTRRVLLSDGRTVDINIPKGAHDGQVLRLKGQGAPSPNGRGPHGDALAELHLKPHPVFRLEGHDLHMDLYVSLPDALLGGKVQAPTPDGPVSVSLAKGSNSGAILRLKGRGAYEAKGGTRGDLFAHIVIALPDKVPGGMPDGLYQELLTLAEKWRQQADYTPVMPARRK
ncbi:DnaJ C-terminal domain-containing protein [Asticcacaulis sp. EMRT-3]|uniref:DnaJ C-terminal domain-containing protein n=1 Tax=Asticcacaulis sp. EMRT-3 TaxID=3040349 RepID=UPI0024AFA935|nr:DnaJ C-terminal domain-containing protein [Asticcacaulis sp. EMRT-3]MDI7775374.1 DnaJ C-terminal domain-containing protein [Asticcacaulis sp. EMRT-3]